MQKTIKSILKLSILFLSISSCKKDSPTPTTSTDIYSSWNWIGSSGGFSGASITPSSEGYSKKVEFDKDGTCKTYKNNSLAGQNMFTLTVGSSITGNKEANLIKYSTSGSITQSYQIKSNDTLFLFDECYDCYSSGYVRIK